MEAQARFSEDILSLLLYRIGIIAAQPSTTGRLRYSSQNPSTIASSWPGVNLSATVFQRTLATIQQLLPRSAARNTQLTPQ